MSFRLSRFFRGYWAVAALACGGLWLPAGLAQDKPAVEAEASSLHTNLPPKVPRRAQPGNGLLRLEEQLSRAFQFMKPNDPALDAVPPPPLPPRNAAPVQSRRAKELLDQKKDWMFLNPDELTKSPKTEDLLNGPEAGSRSLNGKSLSPTERFYQDLDRREAAKAKKRDPLAANDPSRLRDGFRSAQDPDADDPNAPAGIRENAKNLRKLLGMDKSTFAPEASRNTLSDLFGLSERSTTPTPEEVSRKAYLTEFSDWLNRSTTPSANNGQTLAQGSPDASRPTMVTSSGFSTFAPFNPSGRPDNYDPSIGMVNPALAPSAPQDVTARVLNQWNPYYTPPKVEPPKTAPPQPIFDVPRRKF